jgi:hypothetical protein
MLGRRYDVFLSYSRTDTERVAPLRDALRQMGYSVFFDVQSIDPGEKWKRRLERSIEASRTLVLCWSQNTRGSDYITFEYSRAEALHKLIVPWRLDNTPLPAMLEVQGITAVDGEHAAAAIRPALGRTMRQRRMLQLAVAAIVGIFATFGLYLALKPPPPPPPWDFQGNVYDRVTRVGIAGVEVDVLSGNQVQAKTFTDGQGNFDLRLSPPRPPTINVRFRKDGYQAEQPLNIPTDKSWPQDMATLP